MWSLFAAALAAVFLLCACDREGLEDTSQAKENEEQQEVVPVKVSRPMRADIAQTIRATTSIKAKVQADVYSRSMGLCRKIYAEEGDVVQHGDLLAKLDEREIRLAYEQSVARLRKSERDYERSRELHAEGLISQQMFQDVGLQLDLARADHELSKKRLDDTSITAPIGGVITRRNVKLGDLVGTTSSLFEIVDPSHLETQVHVPEQDYLKVQKGQEAILRVDAYPDRSFKGMVERVSPVIDSQSGTAEVTIAAENSEGLMRPGMFVRVEIITDVHRDALIILKEAILMQGDKKTVYVVRGDAAKEVAIRTGFQEADRVEVLEGLSPDDRVVVRGHLGLQGDTKVRIVEELRG